MPGQIVVTDSTKVEAAQHFSCKKIGSCPKCNNTDIFYCSCTYDNLGYCKVCNSTFFVCDACGHLNCSQAYEYDPCGTYCGTEGCPNFPG